MKKTRSKKSLDTVPLSPCRKVLIFYIYRAHPVQYSFILFISLNCIYIFKGTVHLDCIYIFKGIVWVHVNIVVYHRLGSKEIYNNVVTYILLRTLYGKWNKKQTEPISQ